MVATETERLPNEVELDASVVPLRADFGQRRGRDGFHSCFSRRKVDQPAVVRVDQAQIP